MTDPSDKRKNHLTLGIQSGLKKLTITLGFAGGSGQLFPGPPKSLEPDRFSVGLLISHYYSCGLSTAIIEYSCLSVCVSVYLSVCVSVYTITQKIMLQLT